jgi:hypothetical protein
MTYQPIFLFLYKKSKSNAFNLFYIIDNFIGSVETIIANNISNYFVIFLLLHFEKSTVTTLYSKIIIHVTYFRYNKIECI